MSGLTGHTLYAILALRQAEEWTPSLVPLLKRHLASYLAGAYLGCDIQIMPEALCVDTGREVGFGTVPLTASPITGGAVRPWNLEHAGRRYRPSEIHRLFYGRAHLIFGWSKDETRLALSWDAVPDYAARVIQDWLALGERSESGLAWIYGWLVHVVTDSLIKSRQSGLKMHLIDGLYTPRNRPVQDLFAFHEIGIKELHLDWPSLFQSMAETPIEAIQFHYMRCGPPSGVLADRFAEGWKPGDRELLKCVLKENRRWLVHHSAEVLKDMKLEMQGGTQIPSASLREWTGSASYAQLMETAERSGMRETLRILAEESVHMFDHTLALL